MVMVWGDFKISEGQRRTRLMKLTHPSYLSPWRNRLHIKWSRLTTSCAGSERYWFVAPANFCSINMPTMADFRLPMDMMGQWGQLCTGDPMIPWSQCKAGAHTSSRFHWQVGVMHNHALEKDLTNSGRKKTPPNAKPAQHRKFGKAELWFTFSSTECHGYRRQSGQP